MFRNFLISICIGIATLGISVPGVFAAEHISSYDVTLRLDESSTLDVTEVITYEFEDLYRHGIYRTIPYRFENAIGSFRTHISNIRVVDDIGRPLNADISRDWRTLTIRIGDPDAWVTGQKVYTISYTVERAINFFDTHDELYWNVIGSEWSVPISNITGRVALPQRADTSDVRMECYVGPYGASSPCDDTDESLTFFKDALDPYEGLTIVTSITKGVVEEPTFISTVFLYARNNWVVAIPIVVIGILYYLWYTRGRDPKGRGTIVTQFAPPDGMTPGEVGAIYDEYVTKKEFAAEMIYLATHGYMKIVQLKKGSLMYVPTYRFEKQQNADNKLTGYQKELLNALFEHGKKTVTSKELAHKFTSTYASILKHIYASVVKKQLFHSHPGTVRIIYMTIGACMIILGIIIGISMSLIALVALCLSGLMIFLFAFIMPKKTRKGVEVQEHIQGFLAYLTVAEKDRLAFHNAPEKNAAQFEAFLPYAIALGVESEWAKQFDSIYTSEPSWFSGTDGVFSASILASQLTTFSSATVQNMVSASSGGSGMSGGGFSGGGFGGGGGGSW